MNSLIFFCFLLNVCSVNKNKFINNTYRDEKNEGKIKCRITEVVVESEHDTCTEESGLSFDENESNDQNYYPVMIKLGNKLVSRQKTKVDSWFYFLRYILS